MPTFVSRVFSGAILLVIVLYLLPDLEKQERAREEPPRQLSTTPRSNIVPLPKNIKVIDDVPYLAGKKSHWRMNLLVPPQAGAELRPALVFVYAGGVTGGNTTLQGSKAGPLYYANKGYVCVSLYHRLSDDTLFADCLEDLKSAICWMRAHSQKYQIDPQRIGAFGNAYGGSMVSLIGLMGKDRQVETEHPWQDQSCELNAICISAAPSDYQSWPDGVEHLPRMIRLDWKDHTDLKEQAAKASPLTYVNSNAPPMLVIHGVLDPCVDVNQADEFVTALKTAGARDVTYYRSEQSGHSVFLRDRTTTFPMMEEFFARTLGYSKGYKVAQR